MLVCKLSLISVVAFEMCYKWNASSLVSDSLRHHNPARLLCPWDSSGKNTGVGCRAFLQGIFLIQCNLVQITSALYAGSSSGKNVLIIMLWPGFDTWVGKIPLEKGKATHSSILAWRIPGSQRVGHNWATFTFTWDSDVENRFVDTRGRRWDKLRE